MFEPPRWYDIAFVICYGPAAMLLGLALNRIGIRGAPVFAVGVFLTMPDVAWLCWSQPWLAILLAAIFPVWAIWRALSD